MAQCSTLRCVSGIWKNNEKPLISNGLRFVVTCLLAAALWVLFHVARHTFATLLVLDKVDIYTISKYLGHKSVNMTQRYLKYDLSIAKESAKNIKTFSGRKG